MAEAVLESVQISFLAPFRETLTDFPGSSGTVVPSNSFDVQVPRLTPTSTPAASRAIAFTLTMSGGAVTVDLTALTGLQGVVDCTGKKLKFLRITNNGAASVNVAPGGANPYSPWGAANDIDVPAGATIGMFFADTLAAVSGTVKNILFTGTNTQTYSVTMIFG